MITSAIYFCIKLVLLQLYPTYISYKALKVNDQKEVHSLLTFWVVSISYLSIEYFSDMFLFWIPFYIQLKLILILWLILPQTQGTFVFYTIFLDPFLQNHEQEIDQAIVNIQAKFKETIIFYGKRLVELLKKSISDILFKGHETETIVNESTTSMSPYNLVQEEPQQNKKLDRADSQEMLQSYVNIKNASPEIASRSSATWSDYLSSWVKKNN